MYRIKTLLQDKEGRYMLYLGLVLLFMGPLDYITTYYGVYMSEVAQESSPIIQWAIQNSLLFEFIFGSAVLVVGVYISMYAILERIPQYTVKYTWYAYELLLIASAGFSIYVVLSNILIIM